MGIPIKVLWCKCKALPNGRWCGPLPSSKGSAICLFVVYEVCHGAIMSVFAFGFGTEGRVESMLDTSQRLHVAA